MSACFNDESRRHKRARAVYIHARMRTVCFDTAMAVAKTVRLVVRSPGELGLLQRLCEIPFGALHVAKRSRISPWKSRLPPFSLPRKRKISGIIDGRLTNGGPSNARCNHRLILLYLRRIQFRIRSLLPSSTFKLCTNGQKYGRSEEL